jgi:uncharacterized RDD family membrane protein YckC
MTRSYGGGPEKQKETEPELREAATPQGGAPDWERKLDSLSRYSEDSETTVKAVRVDFGKRLVAMIIDMFAAYLIAQAIGLIPLLNVVVPTYLVLVLVLLIRDYFFEGRGLGKNLMGLQVVDVMTGHPCGLMQSIKRNIILLGPLLVLYIITLVLQIIGAFFHQFLDVVGPVMGATLQIVNGVSSIYVLLVVPYEAYRVYSRADGRRFGDQFAGTAVIEAPMDFSKPLPRQ